MTSYEYTQIISLFEKYKGDIKMSGNGIRIENVNTLEWLGKKKKVMCHVEIYEHEGEFVTNAEEKTISILGGCGSGFETLNEALSRAEHLLDRYKFEKKAVEQTSLW